MDEAVSGVSEKPRLIQGLLVASTFGLTDFG